MKKTLIELKNVTKKYKDGEEELFNVIDQIDIQINDGEFIGITGPSGSGKTTLLNLLGLLDSFEEGHLYYQGVDMTQASEKEKAKIRGQDFGFVLQNFGLITDLSVRDNVLLPTNYIKKRDKNLYNEIMTALDIAQFQKKMPNKLSGGQKQRAAIARALINDPKVIFADEPTGNLDQRNSLKVLDILKREHEKGRTVIMVTHDEEMLQYCDRVMEINEGKITEK